MSGTDNNQDLPPENFPGAVPPLPPQSQQPVRPQAGQPPYAPRNQAAYGAPPQYQQPYPPQPQYPAGHRQYQPGYPPQGQAYANAPYSPPGYGRAPYGQAPVAREDGKAGWSLGLGIASIVLVFFICGLGGLSIIPAILALVYGYKSRKASVARGASHGMATGGIVTGWIGLVLSILCLAVVIFYIVLFATMGSRAFDSSRERNESRRNQAERELREWKGRVESHKAVNGKLPDNLRQVAAGRSLDDPWGFDYEYYVFDSEFVIATSADNLLDEDDDIYWDSRNGFVSYGKHRGTNELPR